MAWQTFTDPSAGQEFQTSYGDDPNPYTRAGMLTDLFQKELEEFASLPDEDKARRWWLRYGGAFGPGFRSGAEAVGRGEKVGGNWWEKAMSAGIHGRGVEAPDLPSVSSGPGIISDVSATQEAQRLMPMASEAMLKTPEGQAQYMKEMNRRFQERFSNQLNELNDQYPGRFANGMDNFNFNPNPKAKNTDYWETVLNMLSNYMSRGRAW